MANDLPHTRSTPEELYMKADQITRDFWVLMRKERRVGPALRWRTARKDYGARIDIVFYSEEHCKCKEPHCPENHKYRASEHMIRVKYDSDLNFLRAWLKSLRKAWPRRVPNADSDSDD